MPRTKAKKHRRSAGRILLFILLFASLAGALILGKMALEELSERHEGESFYEKLVPSEKLSEPNSASALDFEALRRTLPDLVGWISLPGTVIDYPIVQSEDDDFYLQHLADKTPNSAGSIFLSAANAPDFSDSVSVLHGHHMKNGSMFSSLEDYKSEDFRRAHPSIRLCTPKGDFDVEVFAAFTLDGRSFDYPTGFSDEAQFEDFLDRAISSTGYDTGIRPDFGERLLLLSTCTYSFEDARFVVLGRLTEN